MQEVLDRTGGVWHHGRAGKLDRPRGSNRTSVQVLPVGTVQGSDRREEDTLMALHRGRDQIPGIGAAPAREVTAVDRPWQIKALSNPERVRILTLLIERPGTAKQVADWVEGTRGRVHYHIKELEKAGLVELVAKVEKGGAAEKAGLKPGDLILQVGPRPAERFSTIGRLISFLSGYARGDQVPIKVKREGKPLSLNMRAR